MDRASYAAPPDGKDGIARFVRPLVDLEPLTAKCKHLGHERHAFELAVLVQRRQNFRPAEDLNPISDSQAHRLRCSPLHSPDLNWYCLTTCSAFSLLLSLIPSIY